MTSVFLRNFLSSRYTQSGKAVSLLTALNTKFTESKLTDLDDVSVMSVLLVTGRKWNSWSSFCCYVPVCTALSIPLQNSWNELEQGEPCAIQPAQSYISLWCCFVCTRFLICGLLRVRHSTTALVNAGPRDSEITLRDNVADIWCTAHVICVLDTRMCSRNNLPSFKLTVITQRETVVPLTCISSAF